MFDENGMPVGEPMVDEGLGAQGAPMDPAMMAGGMDPSMMDPSMMDPNMMGQGAGMQEDPFAWVQENGLNPEDVRKTWENYTQKTQSLADEKRQMEMELAKYQNLQGLADEIQSNPALQQYLLEFYQGGKQEDPALRTKMLENELENMKFNLEMKDKMAELRKTVDSNEDYPDFDEDKLLEHMFSNGLPPNPMTAYRDLYFDDFGKVAAQKKLDAIKQQGQIIPGAQGLKSADKTNPTVTKKTAKDYANMSAKEFADFWAGKS